MSGGPHAYFFIYSTKDGYKTDCYPSVYPGCNNFFYYPGHWIWDGYPLPDNPPGINWQQMELQVVTFNYAGIWWIWVNGGYIGYFSPTPFTGTMVNAAQGFQAGGEVYDHTSAWVVPMGSGASAMPGYGQAAYMHDFMACTTTGGCSFNFSPLTGQDHGAYNYSTINPNPNWNNAFFFGDAPAVFRWQNYNYAAPPQPSYIGRCGSTGLSGNDVQPIIGLSKGGWGSIGAHAILCGMNDIGMANPNYPNCSNSRYVPFGYGYGNEWNNWSNKQCSSDGDWDHLSAQGDCPCNEYVAAVVQDLNWNMEGILCCPGQYGGANLLHSACDVQTFYSTNSAAYGPNSPDWDPNYFKGQCPSGKYVAGISTVVDNYIGFTGAAHALHCCAD